MEKALALQIMDVIQAAETQVNILESLSVKITDDDERKAFRRHLAEIMIGYIDIQMSIARQYPDLDPDRKVADESADQSIKR
jgi:hypothetical protein